ncbi:MAG: hypothetical protein HQL58_09615 [Magnetococcales bacterium]|nr:hypothetical protein [Magnetococcales bacterium]
MDETEAEELAGWGMDLVANYEEGDVLASFCGYSSYFWKTDYSQWNTRPNVLKQIGKEIYKAMGGNNE